LFDDKFVVPRYSIEHKFELEALIKRREKRYGGRRRSRMRLKRWSTVKLKIGGVEYGEIFGFFFRVGDAKINRDAKLVHASCRT